MHSGGSGKKNHFEKHKDCQCVGKDPWATEIDEFVKFGARLFWSKGLRRREELLNLYERSWRLLYNSDPPLENGGPFDFSLNSNYSCGRQIPWINSLSEWSHCAPLEQGPLQHTRELGEGPNLTTNYCLLAKAHPEGTHDFPSPEPDLPAVRDGLFSLKTYMADPRKVKKIVVFVLSPCWSYKSKKRNDAGIYFHSGEVERSEVEAIQQAAERDDFIVEDVDNKSEDLTKAFCHYNAWVRNHFANLWALLI